jgi:TetR/AcrR family transcriptional regulator, regulator of cefoperazone and chloramphenicol sensitivity
VREVRGARGAVDEDTRERLLNEGARLFAARGYARVTVRDICRAAHANVAAINYHFHGKRGLYHAVIQSAIDRMRATTSTIIEAGRGQSPERQLTTFIGTFLERVTAMRDNWIHQLIMRELNEPTDALDLVVKQVLEPRMKYLGGVIADMLDCPVADPRVRRSVTSVQMQCLAAIDRRLPLNSVPATPSAVAELADHIARFSIGGITTLRTPAPLRSRTLPGTRRAPRARLPRRPLRP